ncbi:MAG: tRNA methyl transferase PRC-barrel domain-containing protein [Rikenellaceae bacterium]
MRERVALAFSGGIDSSAAVEILQNDGYDVVAVTLRLLDNTSVVESARARAAELGVEFDVVDMREEFQRLIIDNFTDEYRSGRTPAPCTRCNPHIKWSAMERYADGHGIKRFATGHYFAITEHSNRLYVSRARDPRKDQSYYLWGLSQSTLARALTPMATRIKEEVKATSSLKRESMGICFLEGCHYSDFIEQQCGIQPFGEIIDQSGEVVGTHRGLAHYTIGQKRGEGIPACRAVVGMDATSNRIIVGENSALFSRRLLMSDCNFVDLNETLTAENITVMVRGLGRNPEGYARISPSQIEGNYIIDLDSPAWACAAGQPIALYIGDRVIGGGYFERSL